jgi:hypothetical protein
MRTEPDKIKAHIGELMPAPTAAERGAKGGRGRKAPSGAEVAFASETLSAYRKLAKHRERVT